MRSESDQCFIELRLKRGLIPDWHLGVKLVLPSTSTLTPTTDAEERPQLQHCTWP